MIDIKFTQINEKYTNQAIQLIKDSYLTQKNKIPYLPDGEWFLQTLRPSVEALFKNGLGIMAFNNDELIGFLAGFCINELFGTTKGIYTPLYAHATHKNYNNLYKDLYKKASEIWVKNDCFTNSITVYAQNKQVIDDFFWMGFGLRCVDSIREVSKIDVNDSNITIKKIEIKDIPLLADLHKDHNLYYQQAPMFMPREDEDPILDLEEWLSEDNRHLWAAFYDNKPIGYMRIQKTGESFISTHPSIMNITGAFVNDGDRKLGAGTKLLNEIQKWLTENNYPLCGVDFESLNTTGSTFWNKYFTPYTYSLVRRIDERIK